MPEDLIAYCGVDCAACADYTGGKCPSFPCDDMQDFYRESESHEQAYQRMKSRRERMADEKKHNLYSRQKQLLDTFLGNGAITRAQYDKSLGDLTVKMGIEQPAGPDSDHE